MPRSASALLPARPRVRGVGERLRRVVRYRLVVPMLRSRHAPRHTARGIGMGVFWGLTPTVGFQTPLMLGVWAGGRTLGWHSSLVQTAAWAWVNNPLTIVPLYYLYYVTGQMMLGHAADMAGYSAFAEVWSTAMDGSMPLLERAMTAWRVLGWPTIIGCVPWAVTGAMVSYRWSL
ncbi:MAG: DUF2062 domain-containing protein, partial [Vicinamibacterales bacterium]